MMATLAAVQPLVIGVVLVWSSYYKLFGRDLAGRARRTALAKLAGESRATTSYRIVGATESAIGLALLAPPIWLPEATAATATAVGFAAYLVYAKVVVPESSCGCVGTKALPVSWRSLTRAGGLLATAILALFARTGWWTVAPATTIAALTTELAAFVALSGELDRYWLLPLRRWRVRVTHPLGDTASAEMPLAATEQQLTTSAAYTAVGGLLRSDIREHWDDGEWRFVSYTAEYDGKPATAVFSVPRRRFEPDAVRVAIVDEERGGTLYAPVLLPVS